MQPYLSEVDVVPAIVEVAPAPYLVVPTDVEPGSPELLHALAALHAASGWITAALDPSAAPPVLEGLWREVRPVAGEWEDSLAGRIMMRQPEKTTPELLVQARAAVHDTLDAAAQPYLRSLRLDSFPACVVVQRLHLGAYENEPVAAFPVMIERARAEGWERVDEWHQEIYLRDAQTTTVENYRTVLRIQLHRAPAPA